MELKMFLSCARIDITYISSLLFICLVCVYGWLNEDFSLAGVAEFNNFMCLGLSLKTQELYTIVFVARYLDLFTDFVSVYNTVMKMVFIGSSLAIVYCMRYHSVVRRSYDHELDTFRHDVLIGASFLLALYVNEMLILPEILWAFSIYLEAVAILPQLVLLQRSGNVDNLTGQYVFFLGAHRAFYILNWIYRYLTEEQFTRWIPCVSGLIQTALYADFFYYYFISWRNNVKLKLPA